MKNSIFIHSLHNVFLELKDVPCMIPELNALHLEEAEAFSFYLDCFLYFSLDVDASYFKVKLAGHSAWLLFKFPCFHLFLHLLRKKNYELWM